VALPPAANVVPDPREIPVPLIVDAVAPLPTVMLVIVVCAPAQAVALPLSIVTAPAELTQSILNVAAAPGVMVTWACAAEVASKRTAGPRCSGRTNAASSKIGPRLEPGLRRAVYLKGMRVRRFLYDRNDCWRTASKTENQYPN
jgi:hypothetical protein